MEIRLVSQDVDKFGNASFHVETLVNGSWRSTKQIAFLLSCGIVFVDGTEVHKARDMESAIRWIYVNLKD